MNYLKKNNGEKCSSCFEKWETQEWVIIEHQTTEVKKTHTGSKSFSKKQILLPARGEELLPCQQDKTGVDSRSLLAALEINKSTILK